MPDQNAVHTPMWQSSKLRSILARAGYPVFLLLNRPSMTWFGNLIYDFALRCNGIAITFAGRQGLTAAEANFLARVRDRLQGGVLLDIGANHGAYALALRRLAPTARIIAFEPHPSTLAYLAKQTATSPWTKPTTSPAIELVNKAVGATAGDLTLYDFRSNDGSTQASLSEAAVALYSSDIVRYDVACTTIDSFMATSGIGTIDFLKIDTEGHDLSVLQGAQQALRDRRIKLIQFEFIPANIATGATMHGFFQALAGYRIHRLCLNGALRPLDSYDVKRCEIYVTHNLIATPLPA